MRKYTILKGCHYAFFLFGRLVGWYWNKKKFTISFKLSPECWYPGPDLNHSLNKLIGISFGIFGIHNNSVRLTWIPNFDNQNKFFIYGYVYDSSTERHVSKHFCNVEANKTYTCTLEINKEEYVFKMYPNCICKINNKTKDTKLQKTCYPYFGGNNRAPQKMYIWTKIE